MAPVRTLVALFAGSADRRLVAEFARSIGYATLSEWSPDCDVPDLFLLDEAAAHTSGREILALKRSSQVFLPVLVTVRSERSIPSWLSAGFDDCLRQPLRKAELRARLAAFARLRRQSALLIDQQTQELQSSEQKSRELADQWQATFDASNDAIWVVDREQRVTRANRATSTLLGIEPEELLGKHCWPIVHGSDVPIDNCPFSRARASGNRETLILPVGERRLRVVVDPILSLSGSFQGAIHIVSDVTEQEIRRERDARLARAFSGLHRCAAHLRSGADDWLTASLDEARRSIGLEVAWLYDARGAEPQVLRRGARDDGEWYQEDSRQHRPPPCVEQSRHHTEAFAAERTGNCETCSARFRSSAVCIAAPILRQNVWVGALGGSLSTNRTADPRLMEVLRILAHDIGMAMASREAVRDQERLREQLAATQRLESVGRLAGGVAHDFNNMLTVIDASASFVEEQLEPANPACADVRAIREAAASASKLTRQLLAFSRKQIIQPVKLNLNALVAETERMLARIIGEDIELHVAPSGSSLVVSADPGQLEQVLVNLASNARDAMPTGGRLTIETSRVVLDERYARKNPACRAGEFALLAVSDTGCGMDQATQEKIFEPFFSTKAKHRGTGLGLSTVYGTVKQADGFIWVYSEPGEGTTFKIYLPALEGQIDEVETDSPPPPVPTGDKTILVVEDNAAVRDVTLKMLREESYRVIGAEGLEQAVRLAEAEREIDLLLTDVVMPGGSGRQVAEAIGRRFPGARVLYMSGYTDDAIVRHGVLSPGVAFLSKPISRPALLAKVREVLQSSPAPQAPSHDDEHVPQGGCD